MKKTILASSLTVALGVAGYSLVDGHNEAHASELNIDKAHLADLALNHPEQLNAAPIQEGAYDYHFTYEGYDFNFTSNGSTWSWSYEVAGQGSAQTSFYSAPTANYSTQSYTESSMNTGAYTQQSSNTHVQAVSAPQTSNYSTNSGSTSSYHGYSTAQTSTSSASSAGGSVKAQFLANGGTEAAWNSIIMPESGGNPNIVNSYGYSGLGQTKEAWGKGSVAQQTKGFLNYVNQRYGSIDNANNFRNTHGWY